jgi:hypothetical protein
MTKRINALMSDDQYATLEHLAEERGTTMSDILRDAINLSKWFNETRDAGARILVEREGKVSEVVRL